MIKARLLYEKPLKIKSKKIIDIKDQFSIHENKLLIP